MYREIEDFENGYVLEDVYNVEAILDKKKFKGEWKYKVKWEGYSMEDCTWEPKENLINSKIFQLFEEKFVSRYESSYGSKYEKEFMKRKELISSFVNSNNISNVFKKRKIIEEEEENENVPSKIKLKKASKILGAKIINPSTLELNCLVQYLCAENQTEWISSDIIRKENPELLLQFYESKVKFPNNR